MQNRYTLSLELAVVALVTATVAIATVISPAPDNRGTASFTPSVLGGQPPGAVVLAQEAGELAVALAIKPEEQGLSAVVTVLDQNGSGASGLRPTVSIQTADRTTVTAAAAAGALGTYQATLPTRGRPVIATVRLGDPRASTRPLSFTLPVVWPPKPAGSLMREIDRAYAALRTLVTHERLASGLADPVTTVYRAVAPHALSTESSDGRQAIVLGNRRWDNVGGGWRESSQAPPLNAIAPYWSGVIQDPVLIGAGRLRGRPVWTISFAAPQLPAFFQIEVDRKTSRVLDLRMTASAHFMHHSYGPFNTPLAIRPPP